MAYPTVEYVRELLPVGGQGIPDATIEAALQVAIAQVVAVTDDPAGDEPLGVAYRRRGVDSAYGLYSQQAYGHTIARVRGASVEDSGRFMVTTPSTSGEAPLPRRVGTRSMLPSTWLNRTLRCEYVGADGKAATTSGVLCDWCPAGPILLVGGARTILAWDRLALIELAGD